jgi:hypothetical protein
MDRLSRKQQHLESNAHPPTATFKKPKAGDPVLLRVLAREKQHGQKLDPRWSEAENRGLNVQQWDERLYTLPS